jgi:hypothetical protein
MDWRKRYFSIIILVFLAGCEFTSSKESLTKWKQNMEVTSLGSVLMRNHIIRLEHGEKFSVLTSDGQVLAHRLNTDEFQQEFPKLYEEINTGVADMVFVNPCLLDAGFH